MEHQTDALLISNKKGWIFRKETWVEIISALLILLFLYTGANKLFSFQYFTAQLNNQVFPNSWTPVLAWLLPVTEIATAVALMFNRTKSLGLWASLVLMSLFTVYTALVLLNVFERIPCSCGGVIEQLTWTQHLFFNSFFVIITIAGLILWKKSWHNDRHK